MAARHLRTCSESGCDTTEYTQRLCYKHYARRWRARKKLPKDSPEANLLAAADNLRAAVLLMNEALEKVSVATGKDVGTHAIIAVPDFLADELP